MIFYIISEFFIILGFRLYYSLKRLFGFRQTYCNWFKAKFLKACGTQKRKTFHFMPFLRLIYAVFPSF